MNKRIIYPTDEGGVAIIIPAPEARQRLLVKEAVYETVVHEATDTVAPYTELVEVSPAIYRDQTDAEFMSWIASKDVPTGKPFKVVDVADIPTDRTFRDAWEYV